MTDTFAKSGRPPNTAIAWASKDGIFVEFPTREGPPFITRFKKTAEGLQQALNILLENPAPVPSVSTKSHPALRKIGPASDEVRTAASDIVRRLLLKGNN